MIPLELKTNLRLQIIKDLWLKTDLFAWSGSKYLKKIIRRVNLTVPLI